MQFFIERLTSHEAHGWAFSERGLDVRVEVAIGETTVATARPNIQRKDVGEACNYAGNSGTSGFRVNYKAEGSGYATSVPITFRVIETDGGGNTVGEAQQTEPLFLNGEIGNDGAAEMTPFPAAVHALIVRLMPNEFAASDFRHADVQLHAAAALERICVRSDPGAFVPLVKYLRYLGACKSHFKFVERNFPAFNSDRAPGDKDWLQKANTPLEMLAIAHHLYCLRSHGVDGALAEFGCFKGYSTSMLSYACSLLGVPMLVFDSFEGLPGSASPYYRAGEFAGSLDEVKRHVSLFGSLNGVRFVKGYFSTTVVPQMLPPLACIWMDVDLETSARDVMAAFQRLADKAALFSHECNMSYFGETISSPRGPDRVVPEILDGFASSGAEVSGRFISGYTGAFWRKGVGLPVLASEPLQRLLQSV